LPCYGTSGTPLSDALNPSLTGTGATIGQSFSGYIWLNYTTTECSGGSGCTWYTVKMATLSTKVV
jgi:hypothetical protein